VLLLTTRGRHTGKQRTTPVLGLEDEGRYVVVATNNGAARHPSWYLNLVSLPQARVQAGNKEFQATATTASTEERDRLWPRLVSIYKNYERDQRRTSRELPVVLLDRSGTT
jgi:deazaflavin-dependent oxidoreductase (nitroreductase family)